MLEAILDGIQTYPGLFFTIISGLVLPVPEDIVLLWAGMRTAAGELDALPALVAACAGVLVRDIIAWGIGRVAGDWLLQRKVVENVLGRDKLDRARELFVERGSVAVILGRFLVGMRVTVFIVGGSMRVPFRTFVFWDAIGVIVSCPLLLWLGARFGQPMIDIAYRVLQGTSGTWLAFFAVVGGVVLWLRWRAKRRAEADAAPSTEDAALSSEAGAS